MFNMGLTEILVIGGIALVIFGPDKLPQMARTLGKVIVDMKRAVNGVKSTVKEEIDNNIGNELKEVNDFRKDVNQKLGNRSVEGILNTAADAIERSSPKKALSETPEPKPLLPEPPPKTE